MDSRQGNPPPPPAPLKISQAWLEDEDFRSLVGSSWEKVNPYNPSPIMAQFASSLKKLKIVIKRWIPIWKARRCRTLLDTEEQLKILYKKLKEGPLTESNLEDLKNLENLHHSWLKTEEQEWRQKSRATWSIEGDNNTKIFHAFSNFRRNLNTIWNIKKEDETVLSSFKEKAEVGVTYFKNLFTDPVGCPIQEILKVVGKFPFVFSEEMN
jgi:hypothetical protein